MPLIEIKSIDELIQNHPALPYEDRDQLPERQGIYFVLKGQDEVVYIGKTNNFRTRWISHHKLSEIKDSYSISQLLIVFCEVSSDLIDDVEVSSDLIDDVEVALIRKFSPPLNRILFTKSINDEWALSGKTADIPKDYRQQIHAEFGGICQMCGENVSVKQITITKYLEKHDGVKNYVLICRSCRSTIRSSDSFEQFRKAKSELIKRDIDRIDNEISRYYEDECTQIKDTITFIKNNDIKLWYEYS